VRGCATIITDCRLLRHFQTPVPPICEPPMKVLDKSEVERELGNGSNGRELERIKRVSAVVAPRTAAQSRIAHVHCMRECLR